MSSEQDERDLDQAEQAQFQMQNRFRSLSFFYCSETGDDDSGYASSRPASPTSPPPAHPESTQDVSATYSSRASSPPPYVSGETIPVIRDAVPYPGETYIILHKPSSRAIISTQDHKLQLGDIHDFSATEDTIPIQGHCNDRGAEGASRCQWLCVERYGWLGFRSPRGQYMCDAGCPPGTYISAEATNPWHGAGTNFAARRHPRGGYFLMVPFSYSNGIIELRRVVVEHDEARPLMLRHDGGALWEFVKVDGIC